MIQEPGQEPTVTAPAPGPLADLFRQAMPGVQMTAEQTAIDVAVTVRREDLLQVMQTAKEDERLAFDFLRSLSGVDHLGELEVVYHLYSYKLGHSAAVKVRCPPDDPHVPSVSHLWQTANWHEREAAEMFGFIFDGHPDLRPLLTEEGLGYYALRKTHPLAEIEEWQEDYLKTAAAGGEGTEAPPKPADDRAAKIALAQKKAALIKKVREEARARSASPEEERQAVEEALKGLAAEEKGGA